MSKTCFQSPSCIYGYLVLIINFELPIPAWNGLKNVSFITPRDHPYITLEKRWVGQMLMFADMVDDKGGKMLSWAIKKDQRKRDTSKKNFTSYSRWLLVFNEEMLTFADKVGWIQKGQKHADVIYGLSPRKPISRLPQMSKSNSD